MKRLLALALTLCLILCGCGGKEEKTVDLSALYDSLGQYLPEM